MWIVTKSSKFLNQNYTLVTKISYDENELIQAFEEFIKNKNSYVILNVEDELLKRLLQIQYLKMPYYLMQEVKLQI